jgi:hypothetical protein
MERLSIKYLGKEATRAAFSGEMKKKMKITKRRVVWSFIYLSK